MHLPVPGRQAAGQPARHNGDTEQKTKVVIDVEIPENSNTKNEQKKTENKGVMEQFEQM